MNTNPELKPCPFCGSSAKPYDAGDAAVAHESGCWFHLANQHPTWLVGTRSKTAWNRRAPITEQPVAQEGETPLNRLVRIYTKCPACQNDTLTVNDDKHLLCTWIKCPDPTMIDRVATVRAQLEAVTRELKEIKG
jgi:hypothetical protein